MANTAQFTYYWNGKPLHRIGAPSISATGQGDVEVLFGMSPTNDPIGFRQGQHPSYSISFSQPVFSDEPEVNWRSAAWTHEEGNFTVAGGPVVESYKVKVARCEPKGDEKRGQTWDVTLLGWKVGR